MVGWVSGWVGGWVGGDGGAVVHAAEDARGNGCLPGGKVSGCVGGREEVTVLLMTLTMTTMLLLLLPMMMPMITSVTMVIWSVTCDV